MKNRRSHQASLSPSSPASPAPASSKPQAPVSQPSSASLSPQAAHASNPPSASTPSARPVAKAPARVEPGTTAARVSFELVKPEAKSVCVAGSFNQWQPSKTPLNKAGNGHWVGDLALAPGRHEYLFVVDGQWVPDPNASETVANPYGGRNSVLIAKS